MLKEGTFKKKYFLFLAVGVTVYVLFLYFFVDLRGIISALQYANPLYYSLAFITFVASIFFQSLTWWYLLGFLSIKSSIKKVFSFFLIGSFVDILIPAESLSGEIARVYLMSHDSGNNTGRITASIITQRLIYTATSLFCFIVGSILFAIKYELNQPLLGLIVTIMVGSSVSLIFIGLLCLKKELAWKILYLLWDLFDFILRRRWKLDQLKPKIEGALDAFYGGIKTLGNHPKILVWSVTFSAAVWVFKMFVTFLVFVSLSIKVPISAIVVVFSIIDTLQTIPLGIPGEVGVVEIIMTGLFTALGINPAVSATATILTRVVTMWFNLLIGGLVVQWFGVKTLKSTLRGRVTNDHKWSQKMDNN